MSSFKAPNDRERYGLVAAISIWILDMLFKAFELCWDNHMTLNRWYKILLFIIIYLPRKAIGLSLLIPIGVFMFSTAFAFDITHWIVKKCK